MELSWEQAAKLATECRARGGTVVSTNGCFDLLHKGHVEYLARARALGDMLIVGLNSDNSVKRIKGPERPVSPQESRVAVMAALKCVDAVCVFDDPTPENFLRAVKPDLHVKGGDWKDKELPETKVLSEWGARVICIDMTPGFSTTNLIEKARK